MGLPEPFVLSMAIRNNYGIIGHLSLLQQFIGLLYDELKETGCRFTGNGTDIDNRCDHPLDLDLAIFE